MLTEVPSAQSRSGRVSPTRARATHGFRLVVARMPKTAEVDRLVAAFTQHLDQFRREPDRARQVIGSVPVPGVDAAEQAAWTLVGNALLNLDEAITRE
jgi:hypothetical protein